MHTDIWIAEIKDPAEPGTELWELCGGAGTRVKDIKITPIQRKEFAVHCALAVCDEPMFVAWALKWLKGDRDEEELKKICMEYSRSHTRDYVERVMSAVVKAAVSDHLGVMKSEVSIVLRYTCLIKPDFDYVSVLQKILERDK